MQWCVPQTKVKRLKMAALCLGVTFTNSIDPTSDAHQFAHHKQRLNVCRFEVVFLCDLNTSA
jgi:hypothetical protein